jgi:MYXO-CTERM domain-containing protein
MRAYLTFPSLLALVLFGLAPRLVHAQSSCSVDSECVKGWTCQVSGGSSCASPACPPDEKCEPQPSDCVNVEYKSCQPGPCGLDSDCADGMVCYTHIESDCAPVTCGPGQECGTPSCGSKTESACVPRYVLPCTTASDCGSGFRCESAGEQCSCSGSAGGREDASDGGTPPPEPPDCTCEPSKELRCRATAVVCDDESDCSAGWSCVAVSSSSDCASQPTPSPNSGAGGGTPSAGAPPPDCRPSASVKQCVPPYYELVQGSKGIDRDYAGSPTSGTGDATSGNGTAQPSAESATDDVTSSAGCSVAHGSHARSAVALLGVLGVFGVLRRRRAR